MSWSSGVSSGSVSVATTKTYTTTINFDTPNLETGATLFSPSAGSYIVNAWVEKVVEFSGGDVVYNPVELLTNGTDTDLFGGGANPPADAPMASDGDKVTAMGGLSLGYALGVDFASTGPWLVNSDCTLLFKASVATGGPATAGQLKVHVLVSEPDA